MTIDIDTGETEACDTAITISFSHPIWGLSQTLTAREIVAAVALFEASLRSQEEYTPARIAVEYNALPRGWEGPSGGLVEGSHFDPKPLEQIVWLADALMRASAAEQEQEQEQEHGS